MDNKYLIKRALDELDIEQDVYVVGKFIGYLDFLYEYNKKVNLVGTKEKTNILIRHIIDSISISKIIPKARTIKILDIGTGGGFPGIPLSILYKNHEVFLLESKKKSIDFINEAIEKIGIKNATAICGRAEELAKENNYRENFDFVTSRAFSRTDINLELSLPFCKIGGMTAIFKSRKIVSEINRYKDLIRILGGGEPEIIKVDVPFIEEFRAFLVINKIESTSLKYPRKYGTIKKSKLV